MEKGRGEVVAGQYGTQTGVMQQASQHVLDVNGAIQQQLSALMGRLEGLPGAWKGEAAVSFAALQARWNADAARLNKALSDIADAIAVSKTYYQTADVQQSDSFSGISQALA